MHADLNIFDVLFDVEGKKVKFEVVLILVRMSWGEFLSFAGKNNKVQRDLFPSHNCILITKV